MLVNLDLFLTEFMIKYPNKIIIKIIHPITSFLDRRILKY